MLPLSYFLKLKVQFTGSDFRCLPAGPANQPHKGGQIGFDLSGKESNFAPCN